MVPGLSGPEPLPARPANERADENHGDPQNHEAEQKSANCEFALLPSVVARTERVRIDIRNDHQPKDDERGHDHAGNPGIEIDEHLLKPEEVPRRFRGVHGEVGIGGLFERSIQRDGPDHQNDGDDDGGEEFHPKEKRPDVDFLLPARLEGPSLAVMRFGQRGVGLELHDEQVIRMGLAPGKNDKESEQRDQRDDGNVVGRGNDFPKLMPIHGYLRASFTSESSITCEGPEIPPSFRTRQKCTTMKIEAMMGMPMQCQM